MVYGNQLSWMALALVLAGVVVLALSTAYFMEGRRTNLMWLCLAAIWLLACLAVFAINPTTWPFQKS
jgi:membrane protein YdbS with pleckstrin-like domain